MFNKIKAAYQRILPYLQKAYAAAPFVAGVMAGYLGSPVIKLSLELVRGLLKAL